MPVIRELKRMSPHDKVPLRAEDQERYYAELAAAEQAEPPNPTTDQAEDSSAELKE